jgi:hypothetical protein
MDETDKWVYGQMNYVSPLTQLMLTRRDVAGSDGKLEGAHFVPSIVKVNNARGLDKDLHRHGFQLLPSQVSNLEIDFYDHRDVVKHYYPHCEALVRSILMKSSAASVKVRAFDHNVRSSRGAEETLLKNGRGATVQNPAGLVHGDYTRVSAPRRLEQLGQPTAKTNDVLRSEGDSVLDSSLIQQALQGKLRFAFINVWRNIARDAPVQKIPLACIAANTMNATDLRTFQIHYTDRVGENYFCCPSPKHEWFYYPYLKMDEALILKQWDSEGDLAKGDEVDSEVSTMTVHSAFMDPTSPTNAAPRESIEVRCVVVWDEA